MARTKGAVKRRLTDADIQGIETMAGLRLPMDKIAAILGISKATLDRYARNDKRVADSIERGRAKSSAKVIQTAYEMASSGRSPQMTIFWLKTQEGYRETNRLELTGPNGGPIETTADLTPDQRKEKIKNFLKFMEDTKDEEGDSE